MKHLLSLFLVVGSFTAVGTFMNPDPGSGAIATFRENVKLHEHLQLENTLEAYKKLTADMGLCTLDDNGNILTSKTIYTTDGFGILKDDQGFFPAVVRYGKVISKKVYLNPINATVPVLGQTVPAKSVPAVPKKSSLAEDIPQATEQKQTCVSFPKTLRLTAGAGTDYRSKPFVLEIQNALIAGGFKIPLTGVFDTETEKAVKEFQVKNGAHADGIVGATTREMMHLKNDIILTDGSPCPPKTYYTDYPSGLSGSKSNQKGACLQAVYNLID